jgi:SAM-dependent methyltransferase
VNAQTEGRPFAGGWAAYYEKTAGRPPRPTLVQALDGFAAPGFAIDLGCGEGRDAGELLRRGWRVLALDRSADAAARLRRHERLEARQADFTTAELPSADLINASFCLFICPPERFPELWSRIVSALRSGGRFSGPFLGPKDSWLGGDGLTFLGEAEARALFAGFVLERFEEELADSVTPRGERKRWHIWHVVARKL